MAGDYTRFTFDPRKRYSGVLMQQGRVQLDSDWNEDVAIVKRRVRTLALDTFGPVGLPLLTTPDAFLIGLIAGPPTDLSIGAGRLYVEGWLAEHFADENATYLDQPFLPDPPDLPNAGDIVVYLDVWEREVTYIEDPTLLDPALGGVDTTTRRQTVWQVRFDERPGAVCHMPVGDPPSAGRLTTEAIAPPAPDDPCILPPVSGYRGLENRLYRVEIHEGGPLGTARFKWSRDNGSIVSAVTDFGVSGSETTLSVDRIGRDPVLRLRIDDWVSVTDDHRELHGESPEAAQVVDIDETNGQIVIDRDLTATTGRAFGATPGEIEARHTRVQRWDQSAASNTIDADGLITTAAGPIDIEQGIRIGFDMDPAGGSFRNGDYWVFAARTADASVEILDRAPPRGIHHLYVQLAAITGLGGPNPQVADCRPRPDPDLAQCCCCLLTVGASDDQRADFDDLAGAIAALPNLAPDDSRPVIVCLLVGDHVLPAPVRVNRRRVTIRGCGWGTRLLPREGAALELRGNEQAVEDLAILAEHQSPLIEASGQQQRIEGCRLENQASGPAVLAQRVLDLLIRRNLVLAQGGLDLAGDQIEVADNRVMRGPVRVNDPSDRVRIRDNEILGSIADGVILGDRAIVYEVDVERNHIRDAFRNGIASGFFDPEDTGKDGIVAGLRIVGNEIVECISQKAQRDANDPPFAGVALGRVYDLVARDNRIERNGEEADGPVCGIYLRHSRGAQFDRNIVRLNGRPPDGGQISGVQAGIGLRDASVSVFSQPDPADAERRITRLGLLPAAKVSGNLVEAPRGPALSIFGQGPMTIEDNRFQATDILGDLADFTFATVDQYVGTVFVYNSGLPAYFSGYLSGAGMTAFTGDTAAAPAASVNDVSGSPLITALTVGGQTQFRGNQARLNLTGLEAEVVLANVLIASLDDTVISGNQTEGALVATFADLNLGATTVQLFQGDIMLSDLFNLAVTTRQSHNGFMSTPYLTIYSILSYGFFNHCVDNQTTSCILAIGSSPKSVVRDNAVIFPHPDFCPEDDSD